MRSKVLGSASSPTSPTANTLLAALPADLRAVMKSCTKYTDNKVAAIPPATCPLPRIICSCCPSMRSLQRTSIAMMRSRTIRHSTITSKRVTAKLPINIPPPERRRSGGCGRRTATTSTTSPTSARFRRRGRGTITTLTLRMVLCPALLSNPPQGFSAYSSPRKWAETSKFPSKNPKGASAPRENF